MATVSDPPASGELLPLQVGNEWVYARTKYVRGYPVEEDTVRLRVLARNSDSAYVLERSSQYSVETITIRKLHANEYARLMGISEEPIIRGHSASPTASLLTATTSSYPHTRQYTQAADSLYDDLTTSRIHEHVELLNEDSTIALRMDFHHVFAPGIGQVAIRFVADITECHRCSLISEFWTYELVRYRVQ